MRTKIVSMFTATAAVFLVMPFAWSQHEGHNMGGTDKMASQPMMRQMQQDVAMLRAAPANEREKMFLTMMMDHHQSGIEMSKMALQKSSSVAVKKEAQRIIADQTKEIAEMRQHLKVSHKITRAAKPDPRMQPMMQMLQKTSGAKFDQMFVQMMVEHHQGAVDMANVVISKGVPHMAVKTIAQKTLRGNRLSQTRLHRAVGHTMPSA